MIKRIALTTQGETLEVANFSFQTPEIEPGELVVLEGDAPIWAYGIAFHELDRSSAGAIGVLDPKLGGVVIVASYNPKWKVGDIVKKEEKMTDPISQRAHNITAKLYDSFGSYRGTLFGLGIALKPSVEGIVQAVLDILAWEELVISKNEITKEEKNETR